MKVISENPKYMPLSDLAKLRVKKPTWCLNPNVPEGPISFVKGA
jgi:hypothetical protein